MPVVQRAARQPRPSQPRDTVLSLSVLAQSAPEEPQQTTQFATLVRHFFDRFFTNEMASAEGDAKTRLVQAACALGVPGLVVALYLYPVYHLPHGPVGKYWGPRSYWAQAGDHYFYVAFSLVAMGLVTIFEWDLFFPDLLDVFVLSSLPVKAGRLFRARITAIFVLIAAALFDSNALAVLVLPAATDPPHLFRFLAAHIVAVACGGIFGAAFFLALEGILLGLLGERVFRKLALGLQGISVVALFTVLFVYPAVCGVLRALLQPGNRAALWFPPFWFLGIYQRILDGSAAPLIFSSLAHIGFGATAVALAATAASYPAAWWRKTRGLVEGAVRRDGQNLAAAPVHRVLHATLARTAACRAVWHFIDQNLVRVPRYRMVLVMYGGAGAALVFAAVMRLRVGGSHFSFVFSPDGVRAAVPIVAFWTVSGLRSTFMAPADQRGRWIFRAILGKAGLPQVRAAQRWAFAWSLLLSEAAAAFACAAQPAALRDWRFAAVQAIVAATLSLLLTDAFFLRIKTIPFTGARPNSATNFALLLIPYLGFFPAIVLFTVALEPMLEASFGRLAAAVAVACGAHFWLRHVHCVGMEEHVLQIDADEDQEDFPLRLGLRY